VQVFIKTLRFLFVVGGLFLGTAVCLPVSGHAQESKTADDYLKDALSDIQKQDYDHAMAKLNSALNLNDKLTQAYFHRGMILSDKGEQDNALKDFNKAAEVDPNYAPAYLGKGAIAFTKGNLDEALEMLSKAIDLDDKLGLAYYNRGVCYYYKRDLVNAEADLKKASELGIKVEPELYEEVWTMTHLDEILADASKRIEADAKDGEAYYNRGVAYYYKKDTAKALEDLQKAKELGAEVDDALMAEIQGKSSEGEAPAK
jgi:tetratricopeptide (TPR) repeat protein